MTAVKAASKFVPTSKIPVPSKTSPPPKNAASAGVSRPLGKARLAVRRMRASRARSSH